MSTLFISHSSRDNEAAVALKAVLEKQGHRSLFLDLDPDKGIQAGVSWERTLYTRLRACRAVVALCSDSYLASHWCFAEVALARMEGKHLFVLQIDPWNESTEMPSILTEEQYIDLRTDEEDGYRRLLNGFEVKGITPAEAREWRPEEPPYPGLRAFERDDAPIFFGREDEIRKGVELLNRVRRQGYPRTVMVLGSSGSGKSSLARAGIVPRLAGDERQWRVVGPFRPGQEPERALALALHQAFDGAAPAEELLRELGSAATAEAIAAAAEGPGEVTRELARDKLREALQVLEGELTGRDRQLERSMRRLQEFLGDTGAGTVDEERTSPPEAPPGGRRVGAPEGAGDLAALVRRLARDSGRSEATAILVLDQFEELLGPERSDPGHPATRFLEMLRRGLEAEECPFLVLGTMRSDYLGEFQRSAPLQGLGFRSLSVGPMAREGMRDVIERPARLGQIELEAGLTERLLEETGTSDALPLLAFTLRALWDGFHDDQRLTIRDYETFGGLHGAIAQVADDTLEAALRLGTEEDLRNAFLKLARPVSEGTGWTRRSARWEEFDEAARPMLEHFVDQRLLVTGKEGDTVEVAHEALFRSWDKLGEWLNVNAESLHLLREIEADAAKWQQADNEAEKEPYLWRGGRLARATELRQSGLLTLQDLDRDFVDASEAAERARVEAEEERRRLELHRARRNAAVLAGLLLLVIGLGFKAWSEKRKAVAWIESDLQSREVDKLLPVVDELIDELGRTPGAVVASLPAALFTVDKHADFVRLVLSLDGRLAGGEEGADWSGEPWAEEVRCEVVARLRRSRHERNMDRNDSATEAAQEIGCQGLWPSRAPGEWVEVDGGKFLMGSSEEEVTLGWGQENETPEHPVSVPAFRIQRRELTNREYLRFDPEHTVIESPDPRESPDHPVSEVSWHDAMAYAIWSGGLLAEEAQWEYAARGLEGRRFPWGEEEPSAARPVNNAVLFTAEEAGLPESCENLGFAPLPEHCSPGDLTPEGIHGLGGNVREWCFDRFDFYEGHPQAGMEEPERRVIRGGSFFDTDDSIRGAAREGNDPAKPLPLLGFRVVWRAGGAQP